MPGGRPLAVVQSWAGKALDFVFTPRCAGCRREGMHVCAPCLEEVQRLQMPFRPRLVSTGPGDRVAIDAVYSAFAMTGAVRDAIHELKYRGVRAQAIFLGAELAAYAWDWDLQADVVTPVPLHRRRLRERGYNQSELLAREVGQRLQLSVDRSLLVRARHGQAQARAMGIEARWAEVEGAFEARRPLNGHSVLVIDDVCTTGATLNACARALKDAGAGAVWGLTVAREL